MPTKKVPGSLTEQLGRRHAIAAAATVDSGGIMLTRVGADTDADFEIGSIAKGITGLLYVDALERGEVTADSTLGDLLPLPGAEAARVTLRALSTHTSGLPRLAPAMQPIRGTVRLWRSGTNPYGQTVAELLRQTRTVKLGPTRPRYSNLGFQLLGHAVAHAAGLSYPELLRERLVEPLGLTSTYAPSAARELRPGAIIGRDRRGREVEPWTGEAVAPAGGIRSSITDMARLAQALLEGSVPGHAALDPVRVFRGAVRIGAGWISLEVEGRTITWHNGGTGGFRTWMGMDRAAGTAVVLLSATAIAVDRLGFATLRELRK